MWLGWGKVMDAENRTRVGSDQGWCTRTVADTAYECHWTLTLLGHTEVPDQLTVEGPFYDSAKPDGNVGSLAITGGTGRYAGARGWMGLYNRPAPTQEYDFVYCLLE